MSNTIPLPTYIGSDRLLLALAKRLKPFADGDPDVTDEPCAVARAAITAITQELVKRDSALVLDDDGNISRVPQTVQ